MSLFTGTLSEKAGRAKSQVWAGVQAPAYLLMFYEVWPGTHRHFGGPLRAEPASRGGLSLGIAHRSYTPVSTAPSNKRPRWRTGPANKYFFREHDQADSMFVLEAGKVAVLKSWRGQEYLLRILKEGDCFGEMAVMDLCPRSASVRAVEDCTAIRLSGADLHQVYEQDLKQFTLIQMNMGREVTRRLREADNRLFARMGPDADLGTFSWSAEDAPGPLPRGVGSLPRWSA